MIIGLAMMGHEKQIKFTYDWIFFFFLYILKWITWFKFRISKILVSRFYHNNKLLSGWLNIYLNYIYIYIWRYTIFRASSLIVWYVYIVIICRKQHKFLVTNLTATILLSSSNFTWKKGAQMQITLKLTPQTLYVDQHLYFLS